MDNEGFTYEGAAQRHWTDNELFPRSPLPISGMDAAPQQVAPPSVVQQPAQGRPREQEPLFIAPGITPRDDPFMPPANRSYAHPRLAPTWQHASLGATAGLDTVDIVHRLLVIAGMAGLGYVATGKWQGLAAGGILGVGVNQVGQFALTKSWLRLAGGLAGLGGGGYWMWKLKGGRMPLALANKAKSWLKPCEGNCND